MLQALVCDGGTLDTLSVVRRRPGDGDPRERMRTDTNAILPAAAPIDRRPGRA